MKWSDEYINNLLKAGYDYINREIPKLEINNNTKKLYIARDAKRIFERKPVHGKYLIETLI